MGSPADASRRRWLRTWVREEVFWRDVTTRTLSGLLVVAITFAAGWAGGYFEGPDGRDLLVNVASLGLLAAGIAVAALWVLRGVRAAEGAMKELAFWRRGLIATVCLGGLVLAIPLVHWWANGM